jgi:hypothetical protein
MRTLQVTMRKAKRLWTQTKATVARELPSPWCTAKVRGKFLKNRITQIRRPDSGEIVSTPDEVKEAFRAFYEDLFKRVQHEEEELKGMLQHWIPPGVNLTKMAANISVEEVDCQVARLAAKKSPGEDGITNIVYKNLGLPAIESLTKSYNNAMSCGKVPASWKRGTIVLIFKKGDPLDPGNYRPITLLNGDYKILCAILAQRLNKVIKDIIPNHQIGFMPKRLIYDNVLCLDIALRRQVKVLSLDFRKAYDSVSHEALLSILRHLKFPARFCSLVKGLLDESASSLLINGELTEEFEVARGVKQGDPLSPLLFTLVVELLARSPVASRDHIPTVGRLSLPLLMYADDTSLLSTTNKGIAEWVGELERLDKATGLAMNTSKTRVINTGCALGPIMEEKGQFSHLGFEFKPSGIVNVYPEKVAKVISNLEKWSNPGWSTFLRVSVMKSYADSALAFFAFVQGSSAADLIQARKDFLWKGYHGKFKTLVSAKRATLPWHKGGMGLTDDQVRVVALQAKLGERIALDPEMKVHQMYSNFFGAQDLEQVEATRRPPCKPDSPCAANALTMWAKHSPDVRKPNEVKKYQEHIIKMANTPPPSPTKRQAFYVGRSALVSLANIFNNVRRTADLSMRFFMWLYFQGGLGFPHGQPCHACNEELSHRHIFFKCQQATDPWIQAQRAINLFINLRATEKPPEYLSPHTSEESVWLGWSQRPSLSSPLRSICAATMFQIWNKRKLPEHYVRRKKPTLTQTITNMVHGELAMAKTIKDSKPRETAIEAIIEAWGLASPLWNRSSDLYELSTAASQAILEPNRPAAISLIRRMRAKQRNKSPCVSHLPPLSPQQPANPQSLSIAPRI